MLIDSHCHIHFPQLRDEVSKLIASMQSASVSSAITVCTEPEEIPFLRDLLDEHPQLYASVGLHPTSVADSSITADELTKALDSHPKFVALGESGLDHFHVKDPSLLSIQREMFQTHIELALKLDMPLIVHTRNAAKQGNGADCIEQTINMLAPYCKQGLRAVLHCFTGTSAQAHLALEIGCWLSFTGIVTFKNAQELLAIACEVPLERLMVETDAPYLAPVPHRGERNEPAYVKLVAQCIATARDMSLEDFADATSTTTRAFFGLPATA